MSGISCTLILSLGVQIVLHLQTYTPPCSRATAARWRRASAPTQVRASGTTRGGRCSPSRTMACRAAGSRACASRALGPPARTAQRSHGAPIVVLPPVRVGARCSAVRTLRRDLPLLARRLSALKRVSEGSENNLSPACSAGGVPDADAARPRPPTARLSGSVGTGWGHSPLQGGEQPRPSPQQRYGSMVVAEADKQKLLPGALRGFRLQSPGASEGANPPSADDAEADADASACTSARTILSGKSTARGEIDKEVHSHAPSAYFAGRRRAPACVGGACAHTCTPTHTYIGTCKRAHMYIYTYTYTYTNMLRRKACAWPLWRQPWT